MAATKCNITFGIDYTSFVPVTEATAYYRISGSANPPVKYDIKPLPLSGSLVTLPEIETPGNYDLIIELTTADGVVTKKTSSFKIGKCSDSDKRTIFWNHATFTEDMWGTVVNFSIRKNEVLLIDTTKTNTRYTDPIENWKSFTAQVGDKIEFSTDLVKSGTGDTRGGMFTYSTTGTTGTINGIEPTALNLLFMDFQLTGPTTGTKRKFVFTVDSGLNYILGSNYQQ